MTNRNAADERKADLDQAYHTIGKVSEITGVNAITLRAWERRYGIVQPKRTDKGHRLYSGIDIARIQEATRLIGTGIQISQVKRLLTIKFGVLLDVIPDEDRGDERHWLKHRALVFSCIENYDLPGLKKLHHQLFSNYKPMELANMLCRTLLSDLETSASKETESAGRYYFYHSFLRAFLGQQLISGEIPKSALPIVVIDQSDSNNRLMILWYLLMLREEGFEPVFLDQNPPLDAVAELAATTNASAIVIFDCTQVQFDKLESLSIPTFIVAPEKTDIKLQHDSVKSLPNCLKENLIALKGHLANLKA